MELDSLQSIAGAVVAVVGGAVLHAVVPVAYVLKVVHLQRQVSSLELVHAGVLHGSSLLVRSRYYPEHRHNKNAYMKAE